MYKTIRNINVTISLVLILFLLLSCSVAETTGSTAASSQTAFQQDIENATTVPDFTTAKSSLTREVLEPLKVATGTALEKLYATENGGGTYDGSSWANAWSSTNLRNNLTNMTDASASKVYLIMIAGGTYKPTSGNDRTISFSMKNHVAIMGGFQAGGGWEHTGTTFMSGDIGTVNVNTDNSYHVFYHDSLTLGNSHLYGVTITNANASSGTQGFGGGMYNDNSSPNLTKVTFSENTATSSGGGMYNGSSSSPVLNQVTFSGNSATISGGGMYNGSSSSPVLNQVTFSGNSATTSGGGMYNTSSSPVLNQVVFSGNSAAVGGGMYNTASSPNLTRVIFSGNNANFGGGMYNFGASPHLNQVVFSGNTARDSGGGMYNAGSSPVLVGTVFSGNRATEGGGMGNNNAGRTGPRILNTIFSGNTTNSGTGAGPDIAMDFGGSGAENITIAGSVLGTYLTTGQPINAIVGFNGSGTINISNHNSSLSRNAVNLTGTGTLSVNGMNFTYPTITTGSSAIDLGLYVRKSGTTYYFSENNANWYTGFSATGGWGSSGTPPANAEDMTARDITGKARTGRPDAGVNEL